MTRFAYICRNGRCVLRADGHAAYCPGSDIVCAGASALMCALAGALDALSAQGVQRTLSAGHAAIAADDRTDVRAAFTVAVTGLRQLAEAYPGHVAEDTGRAPAAEAQPGINLKGEPVSLRPKRVKRPVMRLLVLSWGPVVVVDIMRRWRRVVEEPGDAFLVVIVVLMAKELELVQAPRRRLLLHAAGAGLMMVNRRREDREQGPPAVEVVVLVAGVEEVPAAGGCTAHTACWP